MNEAERLNSVLASHAPALARCLSPIGRSVAFPKGIPFQAAAARGTRLNGTIGQVTDGAGQPMPLPSLLAQIGDLDAKTCFLYSPQPGHPNIRKLWRARQLGLAGKQDGPISTPIATHGLTHGLSLLADLFIDEDTTVVLPSPAWENYRLLFTMRQRSKLVTYPFFADGAFNLNGLSDALDQVTGKAVVLLNFPSNPTGYSPTPEEGARIAQRVADHAGPAVAIVDDAYQGVVHTPDRLDHSLYWELVDRADPERLLVAKVDGATKELMFFPSRIGFLSANLGSEEAEAAWTSKVNCLVRGSVGGPPGPSQAIMLAALQNPERTDAEFDVRRKQLTSRWQALCTALDGVSNPRLRRYPSNSAYFSLVGLAEGIDPHAVRERLIAERSVGLIAIPSENALRVAYCSTTESALTEIVGHIDEVVASM